MVAVTTKNNGNTISQQYTVTALGGTIDLSKVSIEYTADGMGAQQHNVWVDNAALQLTVDPWYTSLNGVVSGQLTNQKLLISISKSTSLKEGTGKMVIDLRFAKTDWSNFGPLSNPVLKIYYNGILIQQ